MAWPSLAGQSLNHRPGFWRRQRQTGEARCQCETQVEEDCILLYILWISVEHTTRNTATESSYTSRSRTEACSNPIIVSKSTIPHNLGRVGQSIQKVGSISVVS